LVWRKKVRAGRERGQGGIVHWEPNPSPTTQKPVKEGGELTKGKKSQANERQGRSGRRSEKHVEKKKIVYGRGKKDYHKKIDSKRLFLVPKSPTMGEAKKV